MFYDQWKPLGAIQNNILSTTPKLKKYTISSFNNNNNNNYNNIKYQFLSFDSKMSTMVTGSSY